MVDQIPLRRNRDWTWLWSASTIAAFGGAMSSFAFPLVAMVLSNSTASAALVGTAFFAGTATTGLLAGAIVDRFPRRRVLYWSAAFQIVLHASLALGIAFNIVTLGALAVGSFAAGASSTFAAPCHAAALKQVVPSEQLATARSIESARNGSVRMIAPPVTGLGFALSPAVPFLGEAVAHSIELEAIRRVENPLGAPERPPEHARSGVVTDILEGLAIVRARAFLVAFLAFSILANFAILGFLTALNLKLIEDGVPEVTIGLVNTAWASAIVVGGLTAPLLIKHVRPIVLLVVSTIWFAACIAPIPFAKSTLVVTALVGAARLFIPACNAVIGAYQLHTVADAHQGRVTSTIGTFANVLQPLCPAMAGFALSHWGFSSVVAGSLLLISVATATLGSSRELRRLGLPRNWSSEVSPARDS